MKKQYILLSFATMGVIQFMAQPIAKFTADNTTITVGGSVTFTDQSTDANGGTIDTWSWTITNDAVADTVYTSDQQNPVITFYFAGEYSVDLVVDDDNADEGQLTKTAYITVKNPAGIAKYDHEQFFLISPNPNNGIFNLLVSGSNYVHDIAVGIYNMEGQLIWNEQLKRISVDFMKSIDVSDFSKGVYVLKMNDGNELKTGKVIVQ